MPMLKKGTPVEIVAKPMQGKVLRAETNGEEFGYRVEYTNGDGETHERFFTVEQLKQTGEAPAEAAAAPAAVEGALNEGGAA